MNNYWNSLRPMEKRLVVGVGTMVIILLNLWFVVPHFSDLGKVHERKNKADRTLALFEKEIGNKKRYESEVRRLQNEGQNVAPEDQILHFQNAIQSEAVRSGVQIQQAVKPHSQTNQFFIEQIQSLNVQAKEQQLVDFLYNLGEGTSLIRVRGLTLHADPSHTLLFAGVTLVASYQKRPTAKTAPAPQPAAAKTTTASKKTDVKVITPKSPPTNQPSTTKTGTPPRIPVPMDKKLTPGKKP